jgi:hypothetical protein
MSEPMLTCSDCGHVGAEEDFTGLSEDEVSQKMGVDMESGDIGTPEDYSDMVGISACPECRSHHFEYSFGE